MYLTSGATQEWCLVFFKTPEADTTHCEVLFQVVRAAEEAASTLASSIHPEQCIKVLCPIIQTADYPINLAAIKMQTKVVERITKESLLQLLVDIIPGLLQVRIPVRSNFNMKGADRKPQATTLSWGPTLFLFAKYFVCIFLIMGFTVAFMPCLLSCPPHCLLLSPEDPSPHLLACLCLLFC